MAYELLSQSRKLNKRGGPNKSGGRGRREFKIFLKKNKRGERLLGTREYKSCYSRLRFLANISKKLRKGHNFWHFNLRTITQEGDMKTKQMTRFVFHLLFGLCLGNFIFNFIFTLVHSGLQNTWILKVKAARLEFCLVRFRKYTQWGR